MQSFPATITQNQVTGRNEENHLSFVFCERLSDICRDPAVVFISNLVNLLNVNSKDLIGMKVNMKNALPYHLLNQCGFLSLEFKPARTISETL